MAGAYPTVDRTRTQLSRALTVYLDPGTVARIERAAAGTDARSTSATAPSSCRRGSGATRDLKAQIGDAFAAAAPAHGLTATSPCARRT